MIAFQSRFQDGPAEWVGKSTSAITGSCPHPWPTGQCMVSRPARGASDLQTLAHLLPVCGVLPGFLSPHHAGRLEFCPGWGPRLPRGLAILAPCHVALQSLFRNPPTCVLKPTKMQRSLSLKNKKFRLLTSKSGREMSLLTLLLSPEISPQTRGQERASCLVSGHQEEAC